MHPSRVSRALSLLKLPEPLQERVAAGEISARSAYEISRVSNPKTQAELARKAGEGSLTHQDAANVARQQKGKPAPTTRITKQTFFAEDGWKVVVSAPRKGNYFEIEQALVTALEEVRLRINSGCQVF